MWRGWRHLRQKFPNSVGAAQCSEACAGNRHIEHEHPHRAIIDTAQNRGCDAIQMASHGRRGISAVLLGSETLKVLTHSAIPVIVCRRPHLATLVQDAFAS